MMFDNVLTELQVRCSCWVQETFGDKSLFDRRNRSARLMEEAVELAQVEGVDEEQALKIVRRAYSRPAGERDQEIAGVYFTFLVYCYAAGKWPDMVAELTKQELERVIAKGPKTFRAKQREKFEAGTDLIEPKA